MNKKIIITRPIYIYITRKTKPPKKYSLNLNAYRNWQFVVNNIIKKQYCDEMIEQLYKLKLKFPIELKFTLYKATKRVSDRSNVLSIVEKFFCDALVYYGCIQDDNDNYIVSSHYCSGEVDKLNPRVEIEIVEN